jgi:hypothetical protein
VFSTGLFQIMSIPLYAWLTRASSCAGS